jgi:hypothetical protein
MMETLGSSETSVPTRATRRNIPEDDILYSHRRENLKSYIMFSGIYDSRLWTKVQELRNSECHFHQNPVDPRKEKKFN